MYQFSLLLTVQPLHAPVHGMMRTLHIISYSCAYNVLYLYCIVSIHLYSASCSAHQSEALPVRETQREESSGLYVLECPKQKTKMKSGSIVTANIQKVSFVHVDTTCKCEVLSNFNNI